ncbi:MAG: replication initiator protein A [Lacticaseibacillus paracasei]
MKNTKKNQVPLINYYKSNEVYGETFFQLPKVLFTNEKYKKLSNDAKIAFALLKDRFGYSVKNNWIDQHKRIYFIYTNQELMSILNVQEKKVIRIKRELESVNLLTQEQLGQNKPNRLYLLKPQASATDVYAQVVSEALDNTGTVKMTVPKILDNTGTVKMTVPLTETNRVPQSLDNTGTVKMTAYQYKELDKVPRDNKETEKLDFSAQKYSEQEVKKQNQDLVAHAANFYTDDLTGNLFLDQEALSLISLWCRTPQQTRRLIGIILNAKRDLEQQHQDINMHLFLDADDLRPLMTKTLRRYFNALRSNEKGIKKPEGYLYGTMTAMFEAYWNASISQEKNDMQNVK